MDTPYTVQPHGYPRLARAGEAILRQLIGDDPTGALPLTADSLLAEATRRTGLSDFGDDDFRQPLEILLSDLRATPPTPLGRLLMRESFLLALCNRLRILTADPPPRRERPIIIVGWHRTGTTLLQELLTQLPGYRHVPLYTLMEPVPRFGRLLRAVLATQGSWLLAHEMPTLHPQSVKGPEECWMMLMSTFRVIDFALHWPVPNYVAHLCDSDMTVAYRFYARCLGVLAGQIDDRLVLKGPGHLHGLAELAAVLPDAHLVWTHRDPLRCVASFASLSAVHHRSMYGVYDPQRAGASSVDRLHSALERGLAARASLGDQVYDLHYADLVADPQAAVDAIAQHFGITTGPVVLPPRSGRRHLYAAEQWGLDVPELRARFADYVAAFGVKQESVP